MENLSRYPFGALNVHLVTICDDIKGHAFQVLLEVALWLWPCAMLAQIDGVADDLLTLDDVEAEALEQNYDALSDLHEHPINLNTATREELEQLPFLTAEQVEAISEHLYRYGPMRSEGELAMIESIDQPTRQRLLQFAYLGDDDRKSDHSLATLLRRARHEVTLSARLPFYEREGDREGYLGYPYRHSVRYTMNASQRLKAGFIGSQDAGEPFFANRNRAGYDHYSFYLQAQQMGHVKNAVVGRYRLRLGHGLVMNNDFTLGKLVALTTVGRSYNTLRGHTSRLSYNYLQGAAATVALLPDRTSQLLLTTFLSYRDRDATLNADGQSIRTLLTTGYHRTPSEMNRKNNASEFLAGGRLDFRHRRLHAAVTGLYDAFNKPLLPLFSTATAEDDNNPSSPSVAASPQPTPSQLYRKHYPSGQRFWNASTDYGYTSRLITFSGETATASSGGIATLNTLSLQPQSQLRVMAVQRFYSYRYCALHAEALSEGGHVQNESGLLLGTQWQPARRLTLTAYADYAYFPWPRYQVSQRSHAWDFLTSATWHHRQTKLFARYRLRLRQRDDASAASTTLQNTTEQRLRAYIALSPRNRLALKTQADLSHVRRNETSLGYMLSQTATLALPLSHTVAASALTLNALAAWFHTDDYDSRLYLYERSPLYQMSFPMFYGHGMRYALFAQARLGQRLALTARLATTNYFDRTTIGSGLQLINHSHQTDLDLQLRYLI